VKLTMAWEWPDYERSNEISTEEIIKTTLKDPGNYFIEEQGKLKIEGFRKISYETQSLYAGLMTMSRIQLELWRLGVVWFCRKTDRKGDISQLLSGADELENAMRSVLATINRWEKYKEGDLNDYFRTIKGTLEQVLGFPMLKLGFF